MRKFLQIKITDKVANVISSISIIYFVTIRNLIECNLLFLNDNKFLISLFFSFLVLVTQLHYFISNFRNYILVAWRLLFCYSLSLFVVVVCFNCLELYSIYNSSNNKKIEFKASLVQIKGMVGRRYGSFEFNNKTISHKIDGKLVGEIEKNGLSNYCAFITCHKGLFDLHIIDEFKINYCKTPDSLDL